MNTSFPLCVESFYPDPKSNQNYWGRILALAFRVPKLSQQNKLRAVEGKKWPIQLFWWQNFLPFIDLIRKFERSCLHFLGTACDAAQIAKVENSICCVDFSIDFPAATIARAFIFRRHLHHLAQSCDGTNFCLEIVLYWICIAQYFLPSAVKQKWTHLSATSARRWFDGALIPQLKV